MRALAALLLALAAAPAFGHAPPPPPFHGPHIVLRGTLARSDHQTYIELPFDVPAGVRAITVEFSYGGRDQRTTVDLGLRGPEGFRGWSGGNKSRFTVAESWATPSYLAGPLTPGRWHLLLGVPNLREGVTAPYDVEISFARAPDAIPAFASAPLATGPRWYRGDLHSHTAHSDGSCANPAGTRVPCPLVKTVEAAAARGLDFIAITDHNTTSHHGAMAELQPFYPKLLLMPGREITTFHGHANLFGPTADVDFQLGSPRAPGIRAIQEQVAAAGGILSINHPAAPSGEACMGCGWTVSNTDWGKIAAIEIVNGGSMRALAGAVETPLSGIPFWHARLNEGHRITAIAGSDNHDALIPAGEPGAIGTPQTVVHARNLSVPALIEGIRAGRVFIDVEGKGRLLDLTASAGTLRAFMGGTLHAPRGTTIAFELNVEGVENGRAELTSSSGRPPRVDDPAVGAARTTIPFSFKSDGKRRWIRASVRDAAGKLILIGNPIYLIGEER